MIDLLELSENIGINAYTFDIGDSNSYVEIIVMLKSQQMLTDAYSRLSDG